MRNLISNKGWQRLRSMLLLPSPTMLVFDIVYLLLVSNLPFALCRPIEGPNLELSLGRPGQHLLDLTLGPPSLSSHSGHRRPPLAKSSVSATVPPNTPSDLREAANDPLTKLSLSSNSVHHDQQTGKRPQSLHASRYAPSSSSGPTFLSSGKQGSTNALPSSRAILGTAQSLVRDHLSRGKSILAPTTRLDIRKGGPDGQRDQRHFDAAQASKSAMLLEDRKGKRKADEAITPESDVWLPGYKKQRTRKVPGKVTQTDEERQHTSLWTRNFRLREKLVDLIVEKHGRLLPWQGLDLFKRVMKQGSKEGLYFQNKEAVISHAEKNPDYLHQPFRLSNLEQWKKIIANMEPMQDLQAFRRQH